MARMVGSAQNSVMKGMRILVLFLACAPALGQQVTRSFVGFQKYFYEIAAGQPHVVVSFSADRQDEYDIAVRFRTIDGTAMAGVDYVPVDQEIIFHAGSPTRVRDVEVHLIQNNNLSDRTFYVKLDTSFPGELIWSRSQIPIVITARPALEVSTWRTNFILTWRASATNFQLRTASNVKGPWTVVTNVPSRINDSPNQNVGIPMVGTNLFFQLLTQ